MKAFTLIAVMLLAWVPQRVSAMDDSQLVVHLQQLYQGWRSAMIRKDAPKWKQLTSQARQIEVRNRIWSERRQFPHSVFASPVAPPDISKLKAMKIRLKGKEAKAVFFGKVDFGVGGKPSDNLFVVSFLKETNGWKYHEGEFVKLDAIPEVRKQLQNGDVTFLDGPDFHPDGVLPAVPSALRGPVKYIAKAYVFCPGREVKLLVNKQSPHLFQNTKRADIVIGGAQDGLNEMQYAIKDIEGGDPKAPITLRVYLMSEVPGMKPHKAVQYEIKDGSQPKSSGTLRFNITPEIASRLRGR